LGDLHRDEVLEELPCHLIVSAGATLIGAEQISEESRVDDVDLRGWSPRAGSRAGGRDGARAGRAYVEELLPAVLEGRIEPGRVFDRTGSIGDVPDGYRAMNDREVLKFQITF
jgi:hypothetical protein